ncbi:hypothetical protein V2J09_005506 [Rumex salicifolius]
MDSTDAVSVDDAVKYGFERSEMYKSTLANTAGAYDRHVFLCYKNYDAWPSRIEDSDTDLLPKLLASAIKARKDDTKVKTKLTICGGCDGISCSDGDVLIFPDLVKYRGLKESDVESFVDDVLVNGKPWESGVQEPLSGAFVFVCAHTNRDKRCGVCGPILIENFKEEIQSRDLSEQISVYACSHIGGHKYAGNVMIFGTNSDGKVTGDWFGYVTPNDVPDLIDQYIGRGEIIEKLWRGQMGLYEEETGKAGEKEHHEKKEVKNVKDNLEEIKTEEIKENMSGCCQGSNGVSCCRDSSPAVNGEATDAKPNGTSDSDGKKDLKSLCPWMAKLDQSDVLMAAAVVGAVATVAVAYSFYRRSG